MSKVSFVSFCIENYADYIKKSSSDVYKLFKEQGGIRFAQGRLC